MGIVFCLVPFAENKPLFAISSDGITNSGWAVDMIAWDDLEDVFIKEYREIRYICLVLRQPEEYHRKMHGLARVFHNASRQTGYGDLSFIPSKMRLDTQKIFELIDERIRQKKTDL